MSALITLPAVAHIGLMISVTSSGKLHGMVWGESDTTPNDKRAEIVALEKSLMFNDDNLDLPALISRKNELLDMHNEACTITSRLEQAAIDEHGSHKKPYSPEFVAADKVQEAASEKELRARAWVSAYPASLGSELAQMVLALVENHDSPTDFNRAELIGIRDSASRVLGCDAIIDLNARQDEILYVSELADVPLGWIARYLKGKPDSYATQLLDSLKAHADRVPPDSQEGQRIAKLKGGA